MPTPLRLAIIGLGGFAGHHHRVALELEQTGEVRVVCTCDPAPDAFVREQREWRFTERGVIVYPDYLAMLAVHAHELDLLVVPTPVPLHAAMHRAGVERGIAVYLEKPPTLDHCQLEEMIAVERSAKKATFVGFNYIVEPPRLALKARICAGDFGAVREVLLSGLVARPEEYFQRNHWAGRLRADGHTILDSCLGNAMGHLAHNALFWGGGPETMSWAQLARVEAELYRANRIESADTVFVEAGTDRAVTLRLGLTHACRTTRDWKETVVCDRATIDYRFNRHAEIRWLDGRTECFSFPPFSHLLENHREYHRYLRGQSPRPLTTLADCRPFVWLNDLAFISGEEITPLPSETFADDWLGGKGTFRFVPGIETAVSDFVERGIWPGRDRWPRPRPVRVSPADLGRFSATLDRIAAHNQTA